MGRALAYIVLLSCYGVTLAACAVMAWLRRPRRPVRRLVVTGTFYNHGWFQSHIVPLARSGLERVIVVADGPLPDAPANVTFVCPPRWAARLAGRAVTKGLAMMWAGVRHRPEMYMGYHLFPGAVSALFVARLLRGAACYQMTGGPIEVLGGGYSNENALMSRLGRPAPLLERLALRVVRRFDVVVVRGQQALAYLRDHAAGTETVIIPGSVPDACFAAGAERDIDVVFVGRLADIKRPLLVVDTVAAVRDLGRHIRAVFVGDGPLHDALLARAAALGVSDRIELVGRCSDVVSYLKRARVFMLPSRSEGLSIAMAEAMAAGCVPVVANVGELGDLVDPGICGALIDGADAGVYGAAVDALLSDERRWAAHSAAASRAARQTNSIEVVASRWRQCLGEPEARSGLQACGQPAGQTTGRG